MGQITVEDAPSVGDLVLRNRVSGCSTITYECGVGTRVWVSRRGVKSDNRFEGKPVTHRSSLLAVLAIVLLVLGFTTRAPVPGRRIPIADDRAGTVLATHLSARHSAPMFPGTRPEAMRSGRSRIGPPASAEENTQVVALLEQTLAADPNDAESHYQLGQILVMLDRANDAIVHYERAITIDPSRGDYHFQLGKALHRHGQDERAVTAYQMSIDLDPSDPAPYPTSTALKWHVVAIMESQERARAGG